MIKSLLFTTAATLMISKLYFNVYLELIQIHNKLIFITFMKVKMIALTGIAS